VKDKPLADAFVDLLLVNGIGLNAVEEIFCSSLEGLGIQPGKNFVNYIKDEISGAKTVILLLSPNYFSSKFCLCELGATWGLVDTFFPFLVPPLQYDDVKDVLTGIHLLGIESGKDLSQFKDEITTWLGIVSRSSTPRWDVKREKFQKDLPAILANLPEPNFVPMKSHQDLQSKYKALEEYVEEIEERSSQKCTGSA